MVALAAAGIGIVVLVFPPDVTRCQENSLGVRDVDIVDRDRSELTILLPLFNDCSIARTVDDPTTTVILTDGEYEGDPDATVLVEFDIDLSQDPLVVEPGTTGVIEVVVPRDLFFDPDDADLPGFSWGYRMTVTDTEGASANDPAALEAEA